MFPALALKLVPIFEAYFTFEEMQELVVLFELSVESLEEYNPNWLGVARELTGNLEQGNTRLFIDSVIDLADSRNDDGLAHTSWERLTFHQNMAPVIREAQELLESAAGPSEIAVAAGNVFSAKSKVRELLETAEGNLFIVDPYVGLGTLDCLRNLDIPVRLLTGTQSNSVETDFDRAIKDFVAEGHQLQVRRVKRLHDRHLIFNDRCWLVGGSLKDAGKKPFNCIEIVDEKAVVIADLETAWQAGSPYP